MSKMLISYDNWHKDYQLSNSEQLASTSMSTSTFIMCKEVVDKWFNVSGREAILHITSAPVNRRSVRVGILGIPWTVCIWDKKQRSLLCKSAPISFRYAKVYDGSIPIFQRLHNEIESYLVVHKRKTCWVTVTELS